jgi:hypothetical protein
MFSFLSSSLTKYLGKNAIKKFNATKAIECDTWYFSTRGLPGVAVETNLTLYSKANTPVRFIVSTNSSAGGLPGMNNSHNGITTTVEDFLTFVPGPQADWPVPASCREPGVTCEKKSDFIETIEMVVAQPKYSISKYDITNQDTADWLGDTIFTCEDVLSGHTESDQYSVISLFEVEIDTRYGEYSLCNGYPGQCLGKELKAVGREATMGLRPNGGQCSADDNVDIGNWYSLPTLGKCTNPSDVIGVDCHWRVKKRVKTVQIDCVFKEQGMADACKEAKSLPFTKPLNVLKTALTVDDHSKGGCPDIPAPGY